MTVVVSCSSSHLFLFLDYSLRIDDGNFSWDIAEEPTLKK